ncbi:MAG: bifunctional riboflavin kinase/FAD synthetase, partial [Gemmatimonadota bacterium]
ADAGVLLPSPPPGAVVTVGTFDGVHRGHRAVLAALRERVDARDARGVLVTFRPHPLQVVRPEDAPPLLTTRYEKTAALAAAGVDYALVLPFTPALARYSARDFVQRILLRRLGMVELVVGYDHGLGRGRAGDTETLRALGRELGFDVRVVDAVDLGDAPISSTRIRNLIAAGDVVAAAEALGRPYGLGGRVVRGDGRGLALGFPTANLEVADAAKLLPAPGVYAVRARLRRYPDRDAATPLRPGDELPGAMHIGPRPTFRGASPAVEVHLIDYAGAPLYGTELDVDFCARLRDVEAFDSTDALVAAMRRDVRVARARLASAESACQPRADALH